jgi:hypothetical protein
LTPFIYFFCNLKFVEIYLLLLFSVLGGETGEEDDELSSDSTRMISMDVNGPGGMAQGSQQQQQQMHQNAQMMHMSSGGSGSGDDSKKKRESQRRLVFFSFGFLSLFRLVLPSNVFHSVSI